MTDFIFFKLDDLNYRTYDMFTLNETIRSPEAQ